MSKNGVSHDYIPVPRPYQNGKPVIRYSSGFSLATPRVADRIGPNSEVCAVCGMALTDPQRLRFEAGRSARHTAKPALDYVLAKR